MRTKSNIARHEWIGLDARVERSSDATQVGRQGRVVDETQRTVTLERADGRAFVLAKAGAALALALPSGERVTLDLTALAMRPWDRVKRAKAQREGA
jgi:ribonuclease P protein subunit POP4